MGGGIGVGTVVGSMSAIFELSFILDYVVRLNPMLDPLRLVLVENHLEVA